MSRSTDAAGSGGATAADAYVYVTNPIVSQVRARVVLVAGRAALTCGHPRTVLRVGELALRWPFDGRVSLLLDGALTAIEVGA